MKDYGVIIHATQWAENGEKRMISGLIKLTINPGERTTKVVNNISDYIKGFVVHFDEADVFDIGDTIDRTDFEIVRALDDYFRSIDGYITIIPYRG